MMQIRKFKSEALLSLAVSHAGDYLNDRLDAAGINKRECEFALYSEHIGDRERIYIAAFHSGVEVMRFEV